VYRVEVSVEKNWIGAHFGYGRMRPSGGPPEQFAPPHVPSPSPRIYISSVRAQ
jgi:hypothetical protein